MHEVISRTYIHTDILGQQVVKERAGVIWRQGFKQYLIIVITLVLGSLLFVWSRLEVVQIGYEISRANRLYQNLIKENQRLRVEVASLKSPGRIEEIARNQLGFLDPKPEQIIVIP